LVVALATVVSLRRPVVTAAVSFGVCTTGGALAPPEPAVIVPVGRRNVMSLPSHAVSVFWLNVTEWISIGTVELHNSERRSCAAEIDTAWNDTV
jgi:hypothetical protein